MDNTSKGRKVVIVTGASSGIGEIISRKLVENGFTVVGVARRKQNLQKIFSDISEDREKYKGVFRYIECDINSEKQIQNVFQKVKIEVGPISALINNAGTACQSSLQDAKIDLFDEFVSANLKAVVLCTKEVIKMMKESGLNGQIININGLSGLNITPERVENNFQLLMVTKNACRVFSEILQEELRQEASLIRVTDIYPGVVKVDRNSAFCEKLSPKQYLKPENVADACLYVLNSPSDFLISRIVLKGIHQKF